MEDRSDAQSARGASTSARPAKKEKFRPGLIHCDVSNPTKSVGFFDQHVQFRVGCRSALRDYITTCRVELVAGQAHFTVTRRFNDFAWVRERLRKMYPGVRDLSPHAHPSDSLHLHLTCVGSKASRRERVHSPHARWKPRPRKHHLPIPSLIPRGTSRHPSLKTPRNPKK